MKKKKWLCRLLAAAIVVGLVWFKWPRSLLDITGLRGQEVNRIYVNCEIGMIDNVIRVTEDPAEMEAYLSLLGEVRFQEELYLGNGFRYEGIRLDQVSVYTAEGQTFFEYSSGDGTMVYNFNRLFHISGDPEQLKALFDLVDTWPAAEK